jgi:glycosyltransferase involved in cell wall biosynthesis
MKKNFISILITNYNKQRFIKKCLESAISQKFKKYEIILFDDKSSDDSKKIITKFKNVKLIENKKRKNISPPLNQMNGLFKAFKRSKGNIICLMDADDYFKNDKLGLINYEFDKNRNLHSVFNIPKILNKKFIYKKKKLFRHIWPTIFPTSCISLSRKSFKNFMKFAKENDYPNLEIDARIVIFYYFYLNEYHILNKELSIYNFDAEGITSKVKKFNNIWWLRRKEAFEYLRFILKKKNKKFAPNLDYIITLFFSFIIKKFLR